MVSTRSVISKSSSPFINPLMTVPRAPIAVGIIVPSCSTVSSIPYQGRGIYSSFHFLSILLSGQQRQQSPQFCKVSFFVIDYYYKIWSFGWDVKILEEFVWIDVGLCICHLFVRSNFNFLHNSQWITLPTQSCLVLYSFCTNLLHSQIIIDRFVSITT